MLGSNFFELMFRTYVIEGLHTVNFVLVTIVIHWVVMMRCCGIKMLVNDLG